jgi:hypothetical protein
MRILTPNEKLDKTIKTLNAMGYPDTLAICKDMDYWEIHVDNKEPAILDLTKGISNEQ